MFWIPIRIRGIRIVSGPPGSGSVRGTDPRIRTRIRIRNTGATCMHLFESPSLACFLLVGILVQSLYLNLRQILCLNHDLQNILPPPPIYWHVYNTVLSVQDLTSWVSHVQLTNQVPSCQGLKLMSYWSGARHSKGLLAESDFLGLGRLLLHNPCQYFADTAHGFLFEEVSPDMAPGKLVICQATSVKQLCRKCFTYITFGVISVETLNPEGLPP